MISLSRLIKSQYTLDTNADKFPLVVQALHELMSEKNKVTQDPELAEQTSFIIQSAKEKADKIIESAYAEKAKVLEQIRKEKDDWSQECQLLAEQARQEGYTEGMEVGRQEGLKQAQIHIEEANKIIDLAKKDYDEKIQHSEDTILDLSVKIAEKIINVKLGESKDHFIPLVKKGLIEVKDYNNIKVHIHPEQYELLLSHKDELLLLMTNETDLNIYVNQDLDKNGCYIESAFGRIDISVDTQLQELKEHLSRLLNER